MASSSTSAAASRESLASVIPSKGMRYGDSNVLVDEDTDSVILAALKAAFTNAAQFKADIDTAFATMFTNAKTDHVLSALMRDNDGQELLTRLQAQTTWANSMDGTVFASMLQSLVKAQKNNTSTEIASFLKAVGDSKWGGLDAEIELLKIAETIS
ncbi:hypothetical protein PG987_001306 [Apiospora arundinis]